MSRRRAVGRAWLALAFVCGLWGLLGSTTRALAVQPDEVLPRRDLEARARTISERLRCLVCQNQSIDDSDAPLARDLRLLVRERLTRGDSDDAVEDFVVRRYGEFVLLRPVLAPHTWLLWFGPPLVLVGGATALVLARRRREAGPPAPLDAGEHARLQALLDAEVPGPAVDPRQS